jgi:hydrogenase/urease accessory protein HupE
MKLALAICAALGWASAACSHPVAQGSLDVTISPAKIEVRARVSLEEIFVANAHAPSAATSLAEACAKHGDYLLSHLRLFADDHALIGIRVASSAPPPGPGNTHVTYDFEFPGPSPIGTLRIEQNVLNEVEYAPGNRWEASYIVRAQEGSQVLLEGALLTSREPLLVSGGSRPSAWRMAGDYVRHGIVHILTGYDHLLFIAALALAVTSFWELFKIIAAFTLAHTITLTLSVLDIVRLPSQIVEPMIAASIVFVALQNVFWPGRSRGASRLSVAFFFGLFHGLGFAGGLLDAMSGMPGVSVGLAILSFSLGVEIGHQCVVLPLFGLTKVVRGWSQSGGANAVRSRAGEWLLRGGSAMICAAGMFYLIAALTQINSPT